MKGILFITMVFLLSAPNVLAHDFCKGDFNYNGSIGAEDVTEFLNHFGRNPFNNPCPPDGPAPVPRTGQTTCYDETGASRPCASTGEDGEYRSGVVWPNERFTDNGDGTITDNLTGIIWLEDANCIVTNYPGFDNDATAGDGRVFWQHALDFVAGINEGTYPACGGGMADWRLPSVSELQSIIDRTQHDPALPWVPYVPTNVQSSYYWSSSTLANSTGYAWHVSMTSGFVLNAPKDIHDNYVWPIRGGHHGTVSAGGACSSSVQCGDDFCCCYGSGPGDCNGNPTCCVSRDLCEALSQCM